MKQMLQFTSTKCFNPCNQFLINYLLKLRKQESHNNHRRNYRNNNRSLDHQYHLYTRIIDSIKKYPLPLICEEQLGLLAGVGDIMARKLIVVIKAWYCKFLRQENAEKEQNRQNSMKEENKKVMKWNSQCSSVKSMGSVKSADDRASDQQDFQQQNRDKIYPITKQVSQHSYKSMQYFSNNSKSSKSKQQYKPKIGSQAALILKILKLMNASQKSVTKKEIDKYLLQNNYDKLKQWKSMKDNLIKNGYLQSDPSFQNQSVFITNKGIELVSQNQGIELSNISKKKIQMQINAFKQKYRNQEKEKQENSQSQYSQSMQSKNTKCNMISYPLPRSISTQCPLILFIDTREMKDQSERAYFQETLVEKYKVTAVTQTLTLGDFVFCYNGHILDFVIERKKADDLAASIIDGRYKQQKWRLKNCGATNITYLYEGHPSQSSPLKQKQLNNALFKTRVDDCFKVIKTSRPSDTVRYLSSIYSQLSILLSQQPCQLKSIGTLQQYNRRCTKNRYLTVQKVFGLGLKTLPNVGKNTINNILRYFRCYYRLYQQLKKYCNNEERVQFLNGVLKGGRMQAGVAKIIVELIFDGYQQNSKQKQIKTEKIEQQQVQDQ